MKRVKIIGGIVLAAAVALGLLLQVRGAAPGTELIGREAAMAAALASVSGTPLSLDLDSDDGAVYYDIDIVDTAGYRYEVQVDARGGELLRSRRDGKLYSYRQYQDPAVSWQEAMQTAADSIQGGAARKFELERSWGTLLYEVEVLDENGVERDVRVDASTGEILSKKRENSADSGRAVSRETAGQAALDAIGGGVILESEYDPDDAPHYEIKARSTAGVVYDIEVSAITGAVIQVERDD